MTYRAGRHFLQLPGPSNLPDRVLRAMDRPLVDHRGPEFAAMTAEILDGLKRVFRTYGPVLVFPGSGSGGWEAALVNTLAPGDRVLVFEHGFFAGKWARVAEELGLEVERVAGDWRRPVDPERVREVLAADEERTVRALLLVHNETSTGVVSDVEAVRRAMDQEEHSALLMVDTVSSLASMPYEHDAWGADVTVAGSQKGLMMPPGLCFNAPSHQAMDAATKREPRISHSYWSWTRMLERNDEGFFPYTPATSLLFGLREALAMLEEEGLREVQDRHRRLAEATRRAVEAWGLETVCRDPDAHSATVTTVLLPEGHDADAFRAQVLRRFDMSLGKGLGELEGRAFRIGHLGDVNDLMLAGTLSGVEMGLRAAGVPHEPGGIQAALEYLAETSREVEA